MSTPWSSPKNFGMPCFFETSVPALEDRTGGLETVGTEDMTPRGPEPFPSASVHYGDRDRKPDPRQEEEGPQPPPQTLTLQVTYLTPDSLCRSPRKGQRARRAPLYSSRARPRGTIGLRRAEGRGPYGPCVERKRRP